MLRSQIFLHILARLILLVMILVLDFAETPRSGRDLERGGRNPSFSDRDSGDDGED